MLGTVSYAQTLGAAILDAKKEKRNPLISLIEQAKAIELFGGKISNVSINTEGRWSKGVCEIVGLRYL